MSKATMLMALTAMLGACGQPQTKTANRSEAARGPSFAERLQALPEGERNGVFIRAIQDAQQTCQHVESSAPSGTYQGRPVWTAHCQAGATFTIVIGPGDNATVVNADEARLVQDNQSAGQNAQ